MTNLPTGGKTALSTRFIQRVFRTPRVAGTGDLRGVIQRLGYLHKPGVDAIWLTPLCLSQVDNGYDVANYTAIDPTYGTLTI